MFSAAGTAAGGIDMRAEVHGQTIELHQGDITLQQVDAIVNAANSRLAGGGGVDGAIHRRGGPEIMRDTDARYPDGCPTGSAVISTAGRLDAKHVIHAVGRCGAAASAARPNCWRAPIAAASNWPSSTAAAASPCRP